MLKANLNIKIFKNLFEQYSLQTAQCQTGSGFRSFLQTGIRGKKHKGVEAKKGNYCIGYSLKPNWLFLIGCP